MLDDVDRAEAADAKMLRKQRSSDAIFQFLEDRWGDDGASGVLDDLVIECKDSEASNINNDGYRQQVEYLVASLGAKEAAEQIADMLYDQ